MRTSWEAVLTNIEAGSVAPDLSLRGLDGQQHSLQDLLKHGPVVLGFFKISCPVCQFTFPFLQRISSRFAGKHVTVVGVSQDDQKGTKEFNQQFGITFLTLLDQKPYPASNAYGLTSVPTVFLIEPDSKVKISLMGFDKAGLENISHHLAARENIAARPLFLPTEKVPAHKPG